MEVRSISRDDFNRLYPYTGELSPFIGEGAEWFTDETSHVVGIIARPAAPSVWRYAVLKRGQSGDFQVWHVGEDMRDLQATRDECKRAMAVGESASGVEDPALPASSNQFLQYFQQKSKGSPLVVFMILAGDIITIAFVLFWLFRWR